MKFFNKQNKIKQKSEVLASQSQTPLGKMGIMMTAVFGGLILVTALLSVGASSTPINIEKENGDLVASLSQAGSQEVDFYWFKVSAAELEEIGASSQSAQACQLADENLNSTSSFGQDNRVTISQADINYVYCFYAFPSNQTQTVNSLIGYNGYLVTESDF